MAIPNPGESLHLRVAASFKHHPGESHIDVGAAGAKRRGQGKPSLKVRIGVAPMVLQKYLPSEMNSIIEVMNWASAPRADWTGGHEFQTILDTGASRCVMRLTDAWKAFDDFIDRGKLRVESIWLPDGTRIDGVRVWMYVQLVPNRRPFLIPFIVSDMLKTPVIISWRSIRKAHRILLSHDHLSLCD